MPPQQLSIAEVPGAQGHGAWDEGAVVTHTHGAAVARGAGGGVGVRLFGRPHALRPKSTAPTTAADGEGGAGTIHTNTCSGSACVALRLAEAWHMVVAAPAH